MISDQTRRQKSRQASSRYLSPMEAPPSPSPPPPPPSTNQKHKHKHPIHRLAGKLKLTGRSSISSSTSSSSTKSSEFLDSNQVILPGRLSVDENALRRKSSYYDQMRSDALSNKSETSDLGSPFTTSIRNSPAPASYMASTMSSRKSGVNEVQSKSKYSRWVNLE